MGCACFVAKSHNPPISKSSFQRTELTNDKRESQIVLNETIKLKVKKKPRRKNLLLYVISPQNWLRIIDFLPYIDLKEVGKINKTMNYLVKNSQILTKFFTNKNYISPSNKNGAYVSIRNFSMGEGLNFNVISSGLSCRSFQTNLKRNSLYGQNGYSNSSHSSSCQGAVNSLRNFSISSTQKFQNNTVKSCENEMPNETVIINNTTQNQTLNLFINATPGQYSDFFSQTELDWNAIKRDIQMESKSVTSDRTPSFSSKNFNFDSDSSSFVNGSSSFKLRTNKNYPRYGVKEKDRNYITGKNYTVGTDLSNQSKGKSNNKLLNINKLNTIQEELKNSQNENKTAY